MGTLASFEFHVSRAARDLYQFDQSIFSVSGNVIFADLTASREFANRMNLIRDAANHPERAVHPGALNAMGLIDEALHVVIAMYREQLDPQAVIDALKWFEDRIGPELNRTLLAFTQQFPTVAVYRGETGAEEWLAGSTGGTSNRAIAFEEMILLWLANLNPAFRRYKELFDDLGLRHQSWYPNITAALHEYFSTRPRFGPDNENLIDLLRAPALAFPDSLEAQLAFIRDKWVPLLGDFIRRILTALDVLKEEEVAVWMRFHPPTQHFGGGVTFGDSSTAAVPSFSSQEPEYERFSPDQDWMPRTVMMAKSVYVWLDQLSKKYGRHIHTLDQVPSEELELLAREGFNALWLIGVWQRSRASQRIKQMMGNADAAASAYSLLDYNIADDLGGEAAYINLRDRAEKNHIRMASDMVPNHMGIDSRWVIEHPDWFLSLPYSPYPSYRFDGPDLSNDGRVEIKIEDHYFDRSDASVVFRRHDRWSGDTRYVYHGNDGTSFPWNDTAQLNYLNPEVREGVIQTIFHVARLFPIIRFDAAMTLTKKHFQRLWFPEPGTGGAIPSRAEHGMTKSELDHHMPNEFWREVVDRVAHEVPGTLLLAEAFWLLEGYFVRTLGMHRVYNSAFMNMLRDEENANYRSVIKNTLEFDADVLKRYVNFMNNPDERTAVDQFGKGDKYFGVCTLMVTLPGLPMFGHGQIEGLTERYGMEYRRAYYDEQPDNWLVARHEREISPLLHRRALFAEVHNFLLYDFYTDQGQVNEDVFAYSNRLGNDRALVVYNNRYSDTSGWVRMSCAYADKAEGRQLRRRSLGEAFGLSHDGDMFIAFRDALTGLEFLHRSHALAEQGMRVELGAYKCHVFLDWRELRDDGVQPWGILCDMLGGRGVPSLHDALRLLELKPVHDAIKSVLEPGLTKEISRRFETAASKEFPLSKVSFETLSQRVWILLEEARRYASRPGGEAFGLRSKEAWSGELQTTLDKFGTRIGEVAGLAGLSENFTESIFEKASEMLPVVTPPIPAAAVLGAAVAWAALEALGQYCLPDDSRCASAELFDILHLREVIADSLLALGLDNEERWRTAARLRASFAHPLASVPARKSKSVERAKSWLQDPDISWVLGVHEHEGVSYFNKEQFQSLLWWNSLREVLDALGSEKTRSSRLKELEAENAERIRCAEEAGYRVDALWDVLKPQVRKV